MQKPNNPKTAVRINKYLADKGYSTRRGADVLIEAKKVRLNGRIAVLGDKVALGDTVEVDKAATSVAYSYLAYHKPQGVITHSPGEGEKDIAMALSHIPAAKGLFPIGRLDKASSGLMLLTNDGRITDRLLNPKHAHERVYEVTVDKRVTGFFLKNMERGIRIETYTTKPAVTKRLGDDSFRITLIEGKKHQIRRMCAAEGYTVKALKRTRIMNIDLGRLTAGAWRRIEGEELSLFLKFIGL